VWTLCVLPLENNHKQIRKNLIEKMEINTFSLYLQGDAKRPKGIPMLCVNAIDLRDNRLSLPRFTLEREVVIILYRLSQWQ